MTSILFLNDPLTSVLFLNDPVTSILFLNGPLISILFLNDPVTSILFVKATLILWWWWWSLLHSAIPRSGPDSLRSHLILHEWLAFYSAFLNIHRSGVLTAWHGWCHLKLPSDRFILIFTWASPVMITGTGCNTRNTGVQVFLCCTHCVFDNGNDTVACSRRPMNLIREVTAALCSMCIWREHPRLRLFLLMLMTSGRPYKLFVNRKFLRVRGNVWSLNCYCRRERLIVELLLYFNLIKITPI